LTEFSGCGNLVVVEAWKEFYHDDFCLHLDGRFHLVHYSGAGNPHDFFGVHGDPAVADHIADLRLHDLSAKGGKMKTFEIAFQHHGCRDLCNAKVILDAEDMLDALNDAHEPIRFFLRGLGRNMAWRIVSVNDRPFITEWAL
jgi:hypothetical protein